MKILRKNYKLIIFILILFLSVGFAYLTANLDITGSITFRDNVWDVHLENMEVENYSVDADNPIITDGNKIDFNITLTRPGDYYEFYVDVVNAGTMDATLDTITKTTLTGDYATYLNYSVTYYSDRAITKGDLLRSGLKEKIKVRVKYKYDVADYKKLENIKLSLSLQYIKTDIHDSNYNDLVWNFDSKAEEDVFTVPKTGTYKIETWGASGGDATTTYHGGRGAYLSADITLSQNEKIYLNVGGKGNHSDGVYIFCKGGYNGGGDGKSYKENDSSSAGGGGATSICNTSGLLSDLTIDNVLLAAAGGGGGHYTNSFNYGVGGDGGYTEGLSPTNLGEHNLDTSSEFISRLSYPGTQSAGGCPADTMLCGGFGYGGVGTIGIYTVGSGGGAGIYGGSGAIIGPGAGGASYIIPSASNQVHYDGNESMPTYEGTGTMIGNTGHGYARITYIGN